MQQECKFDASIHLQTATATREQAGIIDQFRVELQSKLPPKLYDDYTFWLTDAMLQRFLIARQYDMAKSFIMIKQALLWRAERNPDRFFRPVPMPADLARFEHEIATGKTYIAGHDVHGRVVVVFNNSVQNTHNHDEQIEFLSFVLELAIQLSPKHRDKYVICLHLETFSFFNCPPMRTTIETCKMLVTCLPERLGHCICLHPPTVFHTVFSTLKPFIDKRTTSKMVFLTGSIAQGSANDLLMKEVIGKHWKVLTGADQAVLQPGSSPGYNHQVVWAQHLQHLETIRSKTEASGLSIEVPSPSPSPSSSVRDDCSPAHHMGTPASPLPDSSSGRSGISGREIAANSIHAPAPPTRSPHHTSPSPSSAAGIKGGSRSSQRDKDARTLALCCFAALLASAATAMLLSWQGAHACEGGVVGTVIFFCCLIFMRAEV